MKRVLWCVLLLHLPMSWVLGAADSANQWEQAAINREWAAKAKEEQSWDAVRKAEAFRNGAYADDVAAERNIGIAAMELAKAGDLLMAAAANYDRAAGNWSSAANTWKQEGQAAQAVQATQRATAATALATALMIRGAEYYELGIEICADMGGRTIDKMVVLSEKAAAARERIAPR